VRLRAVALAAVALVISMISASTYEKRKQDRAILEDRWDDYVTQRIASGRYVDIGVILCTVERDDGVLGKELVEGCPRMRVIESRAFGGIVDRKRGELVGPSRRPVTWYASKDQRAVVLHSDEEPLGQLVYGSEGAGKTRALAMWHYFRWLENLGERREGGQTAPTKERITAVRTEMFALYPASWYRHWKARDVIEFVDKTRIRLRSTKLSSKVSGDPIQSYSWSWCGRDEGQDQIERHASIQARGRKAKHGRYKQCMTATAKDAGDWRSFRAMLEGSGEWIRRTLFGPSSPFVWPEFWERLKRVISDREYRRRVLCEDLPPELAVFYAYESKRNLTPMPRLAIDVTVGLLASYGYQSYVQPGSRFALVAGHDPGVIYNTTTFARLIMFGVTPTWVVVGEYQSKQTTQREHARLVKKYVQDTFGYEKGSDTSKVAFFIDPHGRGESDTDYQTVYGAFQKEGLDAFNPAPVTKRIQRRARIEMTNRLLAAYDQTCRLVVAVNDNRQPLAPVLVTSFESLEKKPGDDDPEGVQRKDETDKTHAPAALGYLLWPFEQEALTDTTVKHALAAARRIA